MNHTARAQSQTETSAGAHAWALTIITLMWNSFVALFLWDGGLKLLASAFIMFPLLGLGLAAAAVVSWRRRLAGGRAVLQLSQDPPAHGMPFHATFSLGQPVAAQNWRAEAEIKAQAKTSSSFGQVWLGTFAVVQTGQGRYQARVLLPREHPATAASDDETTYQVLLRLRADGVVWEFDLATRAAQDFEATESVLSATPTGTPALQVKPDARGQPGIEWTSGDGAPGRPVHRVSVRTLKWAAHALFLALVLWTFKPWTFIPGFDNAATEATAADGKVPLYSTRVETPEFDLLVSNLLMQDWAFAGQLRARARIHNSALHVRVTQLSLQPVRNCRSTDTAPATSACTVERVSLLLARDFQDRFETVAESTAIPVGVNFAEHARWQLPDASTTPEWVLPLPPQLALHETLLRLQVRTADGATVYPHHGPRLTLGQVLATAHRMPDPCTRVRRPDNLLFGGCADAFAQAQQEGRRADGSDPTSLMTRLRDLVHRIPGLGPKVPEPAPRSAAQWLVLATQGESATVAQRLLADGTDPNAVDTDHPGRSALGYAAASGNALLLQAFLQAGADARRVLRNDHGQGVTPLTQALRTDAAEAVERLLAAGAPTHSNDPTGWTALHIAAFEGAPRSVRVLVAAGQDVNQAAPVHTRETPLHTAARHADAATVTALLDLGANRDARDAQGQTPCQTARAAKRPAGLVGMVCEGV